MVAGTLVVEILLTFLAAATVLYRYGNWYFHHIVVTISVLTAWYFSMLIVFVLPLDVTNTIYETCLKTHDIVNGTMQSAMNSTINMNQSEYTTMNNTAAKVNMTANVLDTDHPEILCQKPHSFVPSGVFPVFWRVVYWTSQVLTWLILPVMQSYTKAGDFTIPAKLKSALIDNAIYYGSYLLIAGILLLYLALRPDVSLDGSKLRTIASTASNTWGLFWLVLLLGYGLVEIPRSLWNMADVRISLKRGYFRAAKLSHERADAEDRLNDLLQSMQGLSGSISMGSPLRPYMDIIESKVPTELLESTRSRQSFDTDSPNIENSTEKSLVRLHKQLLKGLQHYKRVETQWSLLVEDILWQQDVSKNCLSADRVFKTKFPVQKHQFLQFIYPPHIQWFWECRLRSWLFKSIAICLALTSFMVVWSELTFFVKYPPLSFFALFVDAAKANSNYFAIEVISSLTMAYIALCAYSTLFKVRVLNLYYLAPHHQTDEYSLIFSGMMLCRLTPPMCLNFLSLIHMDSHVIENQTEETHYTQIMGHMDVISIISDGFNIYFPMMICALCLATYFQLGSRLLSALGFQQFVGDDELTEDLITEGENLIQKELRKKMRILDSTNRRQEFTKRFSSGESMSNLYRSARQRAENLVRPNRVPESPQLELLSDNAPRVDYSTRSPTYSESHFQPKKPDTNLFDDV